MLLCEILSEKSPAPIIDKLSEDSDVRYKNDGVFHDPDNKVVRDQGAWGSSHGISSAITGKSAAVIGADGYKDYQPDAPKLKTLAIKKLTAIANSVGSKEPLYHGFQNRKNVKWEIGRVFTIPLTATSGDLQGSAGYGMRVDPNDNEGPATVFEFPKGTKICGYSKWDREDAEDFGHLWSEAIVAGKFRILNVRKVRYDGTWRDDVFVTVVRMEPVEYFDPETGKWMPANTNSTAMTEAILSPKLYHGTYNSDLFQHMSYFDESATYKGIPFRHIYSAVIIVIRHVILESMANFMGQCPSRHWCFIGNIR
jgi:hypothetical protein